MPQVPKFPTDHLDLRCDNDGLKDDERSMKSLVFIGAAAVSLLCNESNDKVSTVFLNDDRFTLARRHDIISAIWPVANSTAPAQPDRGKYPAPLLAWSTRLQVLFLGFRGTDSFADVLSNINIA